MRSRRPSGAAESENGCVSHQCPRARKRQCSDWPDAHRQALEPHAADLDRDDARRLGHDALDPQPVAQRARDREHDAQADERAERDGVQRPPVGAGDGLALELPAGGELMAEGQRDRQVGRDVQRVPHPVGEPAPDGHDRADDDDHQQAEPDGGQQDARVAREQVVGLPGQRDAVVERVAGGDEHGVGQEQREARDAVDPMPAAIRSSPSASRTGMRASSRSSTSAR